ncbi:MAG: rRNA cytosine-C5-methylase [Alistipes sp.]
MQALPEKFVERILLDLGDADARALCAALDAVPPVSVRLNRAKQTETMPTVLQSAVRQRVPWSAEGYYLPVRPQFTFDTDFHAGVYYVQEAASQMVGHLLDGCDMQGRRVLDLCAAPGGKSTLYASLVGRDGLVVANEIDHRRAQVLSDNVRKWGTGNVIVTVCEPKQLAEFEGWFDVVAVDAPCSGEGMFRKDEGARVEWNENNVRMCAVRQRQILHEAWSALRAGGTLIYSTCTFNRAEDEELLAAFVEERGEELTEAPRVEIDSIWGIVEGVVGPFQTFRFYPHRACGEGFFCAVARKAHDVGGRLRMPKGRRSVFTAATRDEVRELSRWIEHPEMMRFLRVGDTFYGYPEVQVDAVRNLSEVLPVICSGVEMGQLFKGVLKPAQALAFYVGLRRDALSVTELDEAAALCYLRRQEVPAPLFAEGMNLVTARGRALGFAKRIGNRVNNLYPNSLRIINQG